MANPSAGPLKPRARRITVTLMEYTSSSPWDPPAFYLPPARVPTRKFTSQGVFRDLEPRSNRSVRLPKPRERQARRTRQ